MRFRDDRDHRAAALERVSREARAQRQVDADRDAALCADELARCVAEGVTSWAAIRPRLRARCARG